MDAAAILALIGDLYAQVLALQQQNRKLLDQLAEAPPPPNAA